MAASPGEMSSPRLPQWWKLAFDLATRLSSEPKKPDDVDIPLSEVLTFSYLLSVLSCIEVCHFATFSRLILSKCPLPLNLPRPGGRCNVPTRSIQTYRRFSAAIGPCVLRRWPGTRRLSSPPSSRSPAPSPDLPAAPKPIAYLFSFPYLQQDVDSDVMVSL